MEKLVIGILAHVDAGKTTLSEGILYLINLNILSLNSKFFYNTAFAKYLI